MSSVSVPLYTALGPKSLSVGSRTRGRWYLWSYGGGGASAEAGRPVETMAGSREMENAPGETGSEGRSFEPGTGVRETRTDVYRKLTLMNLYC